MLIALLALPKGINIVVITSSKLPLCSNVTTGKSRCGNAGQMKHNSIKKGLFDRQFRSSRSRRWLCLQLHPSSVSDAAPQALSCCRWINRRVKGDRLTALTSLTFLLWGVTGGAIRTSVTICSDRQIVT